MASFINSFEFNNTVYPFTLPFGTSSTADGTAAKTVTVNVKEFSLETGAIVAVKFSNSNSASNPTLNVNSSGAKAIYYRGTNIPKDYIKSNVVYQFIYNGTQWDLLNGSPQITIGTTLPTTLTEGAFFGLIEA